MTYKHFKACALDRYLKNLYVEKYQRGLKGKIVGLEDHPTLSIRIQFARDPSYGARK